jgi:alpha-methylacyl-CoA racemase
VPGLGAVVSGPLESVSVLDLGTLGPGARAIRILSDLGAAVVRITAPDGGWQLPFYAYGGMRGFRRCQVDLRSEAGCAVALDLAAVADVVVEGFRPGVAGRLGMGYEAVRAVNASVVYCSATGFGQDGARAGWAGHDLNYLAVTGFLATAQPLGDGRPALPGATVADAAGGGMHAALAILAALVARHRTGAGAYLDVAATDGMLGVMAMHLENHLATGADVSYGADVITGAYACYGIYECSDGLFVSVAAVEPKFFANLCRALCLEHLIPLQYEDDQQETIRTALAAAFAGRGRDEWVGFLSARDTCVAPVLAVAEVAADEGFQHRGRFVMAEDAVRGTFRQLGPVIAGATKPVEPIRLPDQSRTDTDDVLAGIGYSREQIDRLRLDGVIR